MSYCDFQVDRLVKSPRKEKRCEWCGQKCSIGEPRVTENGVFEHDFYTAHFHPECKDARKDWWRFNPKEFEGPEPFSMQRGESGNP